MLDAISQYISDNVNASFVIGFVVAMVFAIWAFLPRKRENLIENNHNSTANSQHKQTVNKKKQPRNKGLTRRELMKRVMSKGAKNAPQFKHPFLVANLKIHQDFVNDICYDLRGRYLATCSLDRTIHIWYVKDFSTNNRKFARVSIESDYPLCVRFSPDSKAMLAYTEETQMLKIYRLNKNPQGTITISFAHEFSVEHSSDLLSFEIANTGYFILFAFTDGVVRFFSIKGKLMKSEHLPVEKLTSVLLTPGGDKVIIGDADGLISLYTIDINVDSNVTGMEFIGHLRGHSKKILNFSVSEDSTRFVSISSDGKWILWDLLQKYPTNPRDTKCHGLLIREFAKPIPQQSASANRKGQVQPELNAVIVLSTDSSVVVIAHNNTIYVLRSIDGCLLDTFNSTSEDNVKRILLSPDNKYITTLSPTNEECIPRVWYNYSGLKLQLSNIENQLQALSKGPMKDRVEKQVKDLRAEVKMISEIVRGK